VDGDVLRRLTPPYVVSVFPMLDGDAGDFGPHRPDDLPEMVELLTTLHRVTAAVADLAPRGDLRLPGRRELHAALRDLGRPWTAGPRAEPARKLLARSTGLVRTWLSEFDRLAEVVRENGSAWVVTHGEPHPGNVLQTAAGPRLLDWTTVRIAPPERDLWMLAHMLGADPADLGIAVSPEAVAFYRRLWVLADVAAFLTDLRSPHGDGEDAAAALRHLTGYLDG
jgi:spectinomycin phosphotransferase